MTQMYEVDKIHVHVAGPVLEHWRRDFEGVSYVPAAWATLILCPDGCGGFSREVLSGFMSHTLGKMAIITAASHALEYLVPSETKIVVYSADPVLAETAQKGRAHWAGDIEYCSTEKRIALARAKERLASACERHLNVAWRTSHSTRQIQREKDRAWLLAYAKALILRHLRPEDQAAQHLLQQQAANIAKEFRQ